MALSWMLAWAGLGAAVGWASVYLLLRPGVGRLVEFAPLVALMVVVPIASGGTLVSSALGLLGAALGVAGGWAAASYAMLKEPDRTAASVALLPEGAPRRVAVVYFTHGEPETYEPSPG